MSKLQAPLRDYLATDVSETELHRIWQRVQRGRRPRRTKKASPRLWLGGLVTASVALLLLFVWPPARSSGHLLADGRPVAGLGGQRPEHVVLSDGSEIALAEDSRLEVLSNDPASFVSVLRRGRGTFDVQPGGKRRWRVEAGSVQVEVVGTRFTVQRSPEEVLVHVERGLVLVRGEGVPDRVQRLGPGARLVVPSSVRLGTSDQETPAESRLASPRGLGEPAPTPQDGVPERHEDTSSADPSPQTASPRTDEVAAALQRADRERKRGDSSAAIATLRGVLKRDPSDPRRALAAFTLAKLLLDANDPLEAAAALRTCLSAAPGRTLAEDALARLVEAQARSGQLDAARRSAARYARSYPEGRRLLEVRRWVAED